MLFQHFAQAWRAFMDAGDKEKLAEQHELYGVCREIWYEQQGDRLKKRRHKKP